MTRNSRRRITPFPEQGVIQSGGTGRVEEHNGGGHSFPSFHPTPQVKDETTEAQEGK